jgi:hypothetical protein
MYFNWKEGFLVEFVVWFNVYLSTKYNNSFDEDFNLVINEYYIPYNYTIEPRN